jgi:hypothetical protein
LKSGNKGKEMDGKRMAPSLATDSFAHLKMHESGFTKLGEANEHELSPILNSCSAGIPLASSPARSSGADEDSLHA